MAKDRGEDMRSDTGAYNSEEVESSVAKHLAALTGDSDDPASTPEPEDRDDYDLEPDDDSTPDKDDDGPAEDDQDDETDDDDGEPAEGEDEHAIPENVLRSLEHNEWTPEEISEFFKADPKKAMKVFNKIHEATNNMSRQFAELGRKRIELERQPQQRPRSSEPDEQKDFVDLDALRKDDPDNPLLPVIEGMNKALKQLAPQQQQSEPTDGPQQSQQDDLALATQIVTFLGSDHLKAYNDFYGPAYDDVGMPTFDDRALMPGQRANRQALIDEADAIYVGAKLHGRELTVAEALQKAHSLLTEPMRSRKTREELVGKVRKRGKGLTLPPSKSGKPKTEPTGKPRNSAELESRTAARLEKFRRGR